MQKTIKYHCMSYGDTSKYHSKNIADNLSRQKNIPDKISRVNINSKFKPFYKIYIDINTI